MLRWLKTVVVSDTEKAHWMRQVGIRKTVRSLDSEIAVDMSLLDRWHQNQYYGAFYRTVLQPLLARINAYLMRWLRKKYRRLRPFQKTKACWQRTTRQHPRLFAHWAWSVAFW